MKQAPIVLIVDDNSAIRNVLHWSLQLSGYEPVEAGSGLEAVSWMKEASQEHRYPAVILLDLSMPGMNGESFLQWLQNEWSPQKPVPSVIIITAGYADDRSLGSCVKQIITKPFHVRDLLDAIRKWTL